jgi:zinc D-Ala-D-Ala dipeptidase
MIKALEFDEYLQSVSLFSNKRLIDLQEFIPNIFLDIKYASKDNFLGEPVYKYAKAYLRYNAALALKNVQKDLLVFDLSLKIYDAYRPYDISVKFYEKIKNPIFFASPADGSRHNRGNSIDLTLVSLKTGKELKMPTLFDDFSANSSIYNNSVSLIKRQNRDLLISFMKNHDFYVYENEWWHFDYLGWENEEILNIPFEKLMFLPEKDNNSH